MLQHIQGCIVRLRLQRDTRLKGTVWLCYTQIRERRREPHRAVCNSAIDRRGFMQYQSTTMTVQNTYKQKRNLHPQSVFLIWPF